jgi:hypothetical protein
MFRGLQLVNFKLILIFLLAVWAATSVIRVYQNTMGPLGGNDLYTYWYAGHFIRQGDDPYMAFIEARQPDLPVQYIDGVALRQDQIAIPGLVPAPGYTYPFLLFFTPFAFLTWQSAKLVWLFLNFILALMTIPLVIHMISKKTSLPGWQHAIFGLALFGSSASRYAFSSGQVAFLVLFLMLACIWMAKRKPILAGIALGLALSKYSLSAGVLLFYIIFSPNVIVVISAILVQAIGIIVLMATSGTLAGDIIKGYSIMFKHHLPMDGIHLAAFIPANSFWIDALGAILITIICMVPLWQKRQNSRLTDMHLITIAALMSWSLLVAYHRAYDAVLFVFILWVLAAHVFRKSSQLSSAKLTLPQIVLIFCLIWVLLPAGEIARSIMPISIGENWTYFYSRITSISILASMVLCLCIVYYHPIKITQGVS